MRIKWEKTEDAHSLAYWWQTTLVSFLLHLLSSSSCSFSSFSMQCLAVTWLTISPCAQMSECLSPLSLQTLCFAFWCNPQVTWVFSIPHRFRNLWLKVTQKLQDHDFLWIWVNSWVHLFRAPLDSWGLFWSHQLSYWALLASRRNHWKHLLNFVAITKTCAVIKEMRSYIVTTFPVPCPQSLCSQTTLLNLLSPHLPSPPHPGPVGDTV